jgi:hypothetical protein
MQANVITAATPADALLAGASAIDAEMLRLWLVRALTVLLILAGVVMTFYILGTLGFAIYGLPQASFNRRAARLSQAA